MVILGGVANIVVPFLFISTVVVQFPAVPARKSAPYIFTGHSTITLFATSLPVAQIVHATANLYILAFSNPYFTSENPAANVSQINVTVTALAA